MRAFLLFFLISELISSKAQSCGTVLVDFMRRTVDKSKYGYDNFVTTAPPVIKVFSLYESFNLEGYDASSEENVATGEYYLNSEREIDRDTGFETEACLHGVSVVLNDSLLEECNTEDCSPSCSMFYYYYVKGLFSGPPWVWEQTLDEESMVEDEYKYLQTWEGSDGDTGSGNSYNYTILTLRDEYTTAVLRTKARDALESWPTEWSLSGFAICSLTPNEKTATVGDMRARFRVQTVKGKNHVLQYVRVTTPIGSQAGGKPQRTTVRLSVPGSGQVVTNVVEFDVPELHRRVTIEDVVLDPESCAACRPGGSQGSGGSGLASAPVAGSGQAALFDGPSGEFSMGNATNGVPVGGFYFHTSEATSAMYSREFLGHLFATNAGVILTNINEDLQVQMPSGWANVAQSNEFAFSASFYANADVTGQTNGWYHSTNAPRATWVFENPDFSAAITNRLRISEVRQGSIVTNLYTWIAASNRWELIAGNGLKKEAFTSTMTGTNSVTELSEVLDPASNGVIAKWSREYANTGYGRSLVKETTGNDRPTLHTYDSNGKVTKTVRPSGAWTIYHYADGLPDYEIHGFLNNEPSEDEEENLASNRVIDYDYSPHEEADDLTVAPFSPRTISEHLEWVTVRRKFMVYTPGTNLTSEAVSPTAGYGTVGNLVETRVNYLLGDFRDHLPQRIDHADGTRTVYFYEQTGTNRTTTTLTGAPDTMNATNVLRGRKEITVEGLVGQHHQTQTIDISTGILMSQVVSTNFDAFNRPQKTSYLDGTHEGFAYGCCQLQSVTNRDGTVTAFTFDALGREQTKTELGVTMINGWDGANRLLSSIRQGTNASQIELLRTAYDLHGRRVFSVGAMGDTNYYSQGTNGSGETLLTNVFPNGAIRVERKAKDGSLMEVYGTGVNPVKYYYGTELTSLYLEPGPAAAYYVKEVKVDSSGGENEWTKSYTDLNGRNFRTVFAAETGTPAVHNWYNIHGELEKTVDVDGITQMFLYNAEGEKEYDVLDVDQDGAVDWAGADRITQTVSDVVNDGTVGNIVRQRRFVWGTDGSNSSNVVATTASSVNGLTNWSVIWNGSGSVTNRTEVSYPSVGTRRVTAFAPNGASVVTDSIGDRVQSITEKNSSGTQVFKESRLYDAHGRVQYSVDARNGTTTFAYNDADQEVSRTSPLPGNGGVAQTVSTVYDDMGRPWKIIQADGTVVTNLYTLRGEPRLTSGSRVYPAELSYDAQGRKKTLKTWQNFAAGTETNITEWTYDAYRGWLTNKVYGSSPGPQYTYTPGGALASRLWARGITTTYANDTAGMLYSVNYSDGTAGITNVYDRLGRLLETRHNGIVTTNFYNGAGLLLGEFHVGGELNGLAVTNDYDSLLRRSSSRAAGYGGSINSYTYDTANRLATVGDGTNSAAYSYLANSRLVSQILHKQSTTTRMTTSKQYDLLNRLLSINSVASATNTLPFYFGYNYNKANQRVRVNHGDGTYWIYGYDALGQLISGRKHWSDGTPVEGQQHEYLFDDIGNRKSTGEGGDITGGNLRPATYNRNLLNQITSRGVPNEVDIIGSSTSATAVTVNSSPVDYQRGSYFRKELTVSNGSGPAWTAVTVAADTTKTGNILTPPATQTFGYDADGNLTNDLVWTYVWDGENRLREIQPLTNNPASSKKWLTFQYDYKGRRIAKWAADWTNSTWAVRINNRFLYDGWNLLGELNATNNALIRGYIWGLDVSGSLQGAGGVGGLIAINDPANGTHFCAYDGNGNVVGTVKSDGTVTSIIEYDPFGQVKRRTGSFAEMNLFLFSTKYYDAEVGLNYYGHRYYTPSTGRWLSRDPVGERGGINIFSFVRNDSLNRIDKWGLYELQFDLSDFPNGSFQEEGKISLGIATAAKHAAKIRAEAEGLLKGCLCEKLKKQLKDLIKVMGKIEKGAASKSENLEIEQRELTGDAYAQLKPGGGFFDPVMTLNTADKYDWFTAGEAELASTLLHELSHIYGTEDDDDTLSNAHTIEEAIGGIAKTSRYKGLLVDCRKEAK